MPQAVLSTKRKPSTKRTRNSTLKVKSGCITCKVRHVKCDEQKPSCHRCTSTGRKCDGYATATPISLIKPVQYAQFAEGVEYLEFYHHSTAQTLSNQFDNGFWSRTTLQLALCEPSIRHGLIALSYLSKSLPTSVRDVHAKAAPSNMFYYYYSKAVGSLARRMAEPSCTLEISLTACLIFVCIDLLQDKRSSAVEHFQSGIKLIAERCGAKNELLPYSKTSRKLAKGLPASSNKGNAILEETIIPIFRRNIIVALLKGIPINTIVPVQDILSPSIPMPAPGTICTIADLSLLGDHIRNASVFFAQNAAVKTMSKQPYTPQDTSSQQQLLAHHNAWFAALLDLENSRQLSAAELTMSSAQKVANWISYIIIACALDFRQMNYDNYIPTFQQINHHASILLSNPPSSPAGKSSQTQNSHFTFELSLIPSLSFAAARCRCPTTRRISLALLQRTPARESFYDAEVQRAIVARIIEIEEQCLDPETGRPAAHSRLLGMGSRGGFDKEESFDKEGRALVTFSYVGWWEQWMKGGVLDDAGSWEEKVGWVEGIERVR
ncbi:unnamed protein product [Periconia digitata]|uniref:Zn(2)-C6 fungal-type domain-containing protein n=1 Tax=Periconia digitata TaxID=1303443 RepID=A0A9W4UAL8_9PLEO|nr:unnamed protein product [Periconia digitata]